MQGSNSIRHSTIAGARAMAPVLLGVAPFGMTFAVVAQVAGADWLQIMAMGALVFAGASQLVVVDLLQTGAPLLLALAAGITVNLRFMMYSAGMAPRYSEESLLRRGIVAFLLTDQAYAVTTLRLKKERAVDCFAYTMGAAGIMYATWLAGTAAGILLGAVIPPSLSLDFAVPVTFLALVAPSISDSPTKLAAGVAAAAALLLHGLPKGMGLMIAAMLGIAAGMWLEHRQERESGNSANAASVDSPCAAAGASSSPAVDASSSSPPSANE